MSRQQDARIPLPPFPGAPPQYQQGNEQQFRRTVEQAFQMQPPPQRDYIHISHHGFRPSQLTGPVDWGAAINNTSMGTLGELENFYAPLLIPIGALITGISFRARRGAAGNTCEATLIRQNEDSSTSDLATVTNASATTVTGSATLSPTERVESTSHYLAQVLMDFASAGTGPSFEYVRVEYTL